jgi:hypothetical protein
MDKKELKFYEAPAFEVVKVEYRAMLCASPGQNDGDVQDEFEG